MSVLFVSGATLTLLLIVAVWIVMRASPGIALLGEPRKGEIAAELLSEYIKDLSFSVRLHRWIGLISIALLLVVLCIIVWETRARGWSNLLLLHTANGGAFGALARVVFKRVDLYENLLRDALGISSKKGIPQA